MKKITSLLAAAAALCLAASCNKELPEEAPEAAMETVVFTASLDDADTKAALNGNKTEWTAGDKVTIHNGTTGFAFTAANSGASTKLTYDKNDFSGSKFIAVYPAGEYSADVNAKTVKAAIPTYQASRSNTFNESAALAVAYTENDNLAFKHAVSLLKFTVKGNNIKGVIFYGHDNEGVSGDVLVSLNADNSIKSVVPQETTITENDVTETKIITWTKLYADTPEKNWCFEEGVTYYMAVVPQTYSQGFTVQVDVDGVGTKDLKKIESSKTLASGTIYNLGELEYEAPAVAEWAVAGTFNEWSTTANPMALENGYYVIKNVSGLNYTAPVGEDTGSSTGIKFVCNGGDWKGSVGEVSTGKWEYVWDKDSGSNIYVKGADAATKYDIYVNPSEGDNGKFVIVAAGQAMPEDTPAEPEEPGESLEWAIPGAYNGWNTTAAMTKEGNFYVARNVDKLHNDSNGFKILNNGNWLGYGAVSLNQWVFLGGGGNIYVTGAAEATKYDVYVHADTKKIIVLAAGSAAPSVPEATEYYRFYVKNNKGWNPIYFYAWGTYTSSNWPGDKFTKEANAGESYGVCKYVEIPKGAVVENFIINVGSDANKTGDLKLSDAVALSDGNYIYVLE